MMEPFPEKWELLALFEVEPRVLDPDVPWGYNHLTFDTTRGADRILCVIEPGYRQLDFTWWHNETRHLSLKLHSIAGLTIAVGGGNDCLIATFQDVNVSPLRLQLKPTIECEWGTTSD